MKGALLPLFICFIRILCSLLITHAVGSFDEIVRTAVQGKWIPWLADTLPTRAPPPLPSSRSDLFSADDVFLSDFKIFSNTFFPYDLLNDSSPLRSNILMKRPPLFPVSAAFEGVGSPLPLFVQDPGFSHKKHRSWSAGPQFGEAGLGVAFT